MIRSVSLVIHYKNVLSVNLPTEWKKTNVDVKRAFLMTEKNANNVFMLIRKKLVVCVKGMCLMVRNVKAKKNVLKNLIEVSLIFK